MKFFIYTFFLLYASINALPAGPVYGSAHVDVYVPKITPITFNVTSILNQKLPNAERPKGRESASLDHPGLIAQKDSIYDNAQKVFIHILHPKPIIDTIQEHEKYGNTGDQFRKIGNAIVGGYENFSNFLNAASEFPFEAVKQFSRKASSYLSGVGAKLVGL